ncbi:hypothetical protein J6590_003637 [Homalodisca vitripennis]|nr:hypothetical protein J6590_003637 [Homalodisca vitripennis]
MRITTNHRGRLGTIRAGRPDRSENSRTDKMDLTHSWGMTDASVRTDVGIITELIFPRDRANNSVNHLQI